MNKLEKQTSDMTPLEHIIYEAIGTASMCWKETPTGVFDDVMAKEVADRVWKAVKEELNKRVELKEDFEIIEEGTVYHLPLYEVIDGVGIKRLPKHSEGSGNHGFHAVCFVRGSKVGSENVEKRTGTLHEHLLAMMIHDLEYKNKLVPSREAALTITKLQEALHWQRQRQIDRTKRDVVGTYKK